MEREFAVYLRLQERRIELLRSLCASFRESHKAIAGLNLDAMYQTTFEQETICTAIRSVDEELKAAQRMIETSLRIESSHAQLPSALPDEAPVATELAERLKSVARELESAQAEVRQMNKVQASLLRRSRRSVNVLVNFLANYTETYKPPQVASQSAPNATPVGASAGAR